MGRIVGIVVGALLIIVAGFLYLRQPEGESSAPTGDDAAQAPAAVPAEVVEVPEAPETPLRSDGVPSGAGDASESAIQPGLSADDTNAVVSEDRRGRPENVVSVNLPIQDVPPSGVQSPESPVEYASDQARAEAEATASIDNSGAQQQFPGPGDEVRLQAGSDGIQAAGENLLGPGTAPEAFGDESSFPAPEADNVVTDTSAPETGDGN